jgi:tRNA pseudouridine55 synthase
VTTSPDAVVAEGLVLIDKPAGWTSHDVVARVRRIAGTRRVGHAGTLDPMATGLLVVGLGRATRLLGYLSKTDKEYTGTIRLGIATATDDAEGEVIATADQPGWTLPDAQAAIRALTGELEQVPPAYSAISVDGRRSYARARAGEDVVLAPRRVQVTEFEVLAVRGDDLDVRVVCTSGTYIRSLARDLGAALGVGGHLAALRRTRIGPFRISAARTLADLEQRFDLLNLTDAVGLAFPRREVAAEQAQGLRHGRALPAGGAEPGPVGVFGPDGSVLALVQDRGGVARPVCVFA